MCKKEMKLKNPIMVGFVAVVSGVDVVVVVGVNVVVCLCGLKVTAWLV